MAKIVVSFSMTPVGTCETGVSKYVRAVLTTLERLGFRYRVGAGFTDVELDGFTELARLLEECHAELVKMGVKRVSTLVKIGYRVDKEQSIDAMLGSLASAPNRKQHAS